MIKGKSKSKIKHTVTLPKKSNDQSHKNTSRRAQQKQNGINSLRLTQVLGVHKKVNKNHQESVSNGKNKNRSTANFGASIKNHPKKIEDERFIDKLFSKTQKIHQKQPNFVQQLIQEIVPSDELAQEIQVDSQDKIKKLETELSLKNKESKVLTQQLQELKLYVSSFTFKVFDLTILCKKLVNHTLLQKEKNILNQKVSEVVSYIQSLVRQWNLEEKIKLHTQSTFSKNMKLTLEIENQKILDTKKRCHTESLKIPLQQYLESLKKEQVKESSKEPQKIVEKKYSISTQFHSKVKTIEKFSKNSQFNISIPQNISETNRSKEDESEEIMKIVSRRNSEVKKQDDQIYVILRNHEPTNNHELRLKSGDRVVVLDKTNPIKWVGLKDGIIGYFPKDILF